MKSIYIKVSLVLILTFLFGAAFGSLGTIHALRSVARKLANPESRNELILARMNSRLGLTAEQHQQVAEAFKEMEPELVAFQAKARQDRQALIDNLQARIMPILTADQKQKLTQLRQKRTSGIEQFLGIAKV